LIVIGRRDYLVLKM